MRFESLSIARWLAILFCAQLILIAPGFVDPGYLDGPVGLLLVVPYLSVYIGNSLGIPGICWWGWGVCAPTLAGWLWIAAVWLILMFAAATLAKNLSSLFTGKS